MCGVYRSGGSGYGGPAANEKFYDPERVILSIKIPDNIILCTNIARFSQSYDKEQTQNIDACLCAKRQRFWLVKTLMWTIIDPYATYLNPSDQKLHVCHPVQEPRARSPRHSSWAWELMSSTNSQLQLSMNAIIQTCSRKNCKIAISVEYCSVARILLSVHHCIPFLHPSVQNAQNIQNVLESLFLRWINIDMTFFIIPKNLNNPVQLGSFQLSVVCLPNSLCGFNWH